jgi:RNA polymerase sigma factor (sigma-70 family)
LRQACWRAVTELQALPSIIAAEMTVLHSICSSGPDTTACSHAPSRPEHELVKLVAAVRRGDNAAWTQLIERFDRMLRGIARSYRLSAADVDDVVQATWTRLHQHIGAVREPAAIAGWLATTTRRESLRVLQVHMRELLTADPELGEGVEQERPESELLASEERGVLGRALATLPDRQRRLMILLATDPDADYRRISAQLAMPIGSIGPIRARGLARLGRHPELRRHYLCAG